MQDYREERREEAKGSPKKGFWGRMIEKIDKAMVEKSSQSSCCGKDSKGGKCC